MSDQVIPFVEVSVRLKDDDTTFTRKFPCYEPLYLSPDKDPLASFIAEVKRDFKGQLLEADCTVKTTMVLS